MTNARKKLGDFHCAKNVVVMNMDLKTLCVMPHPANVPAKQTLLERNVTNALKDFMAFQTVKVAPAMLMDLRAQFVTRLVNALVKPTSLETLVIHARKSSTDSPTAKNANVMLKDQQMSQLVELKMVNVLVSQM